ncbi:MAG: hypothetical protein J1F12_05825 [Muribaculaceae bacterium]|nr:hypothetical protein [Muribaculaceae bacterium]
MEKFDTLRLGNEVTVTIWGPDGSCLYKSTSDGDHTIEGAIEKALSEANLKVDPEDCVFEVKDHSTGVAHRYRINAHGHLKLIV